MGAFEGSLSFKTFYVRGETPNDFEADYLNRLHQHFFEPLSPIGEEERSVGWVPIQDPIATAFEREQVFYNSYVTFAMRIDKWALPTAWVKAMMRKAIAEYRPSLVVDVEGDDVAHRDDGGDRARTKSKLSKRERDKIKLEVTTELKHKILPSMKIIDVCWNVAEGKLRLWTSSKSVCDEFASLFELTFGLSLDEDSPYLMAEHLGIEQEALERMVEADPWFVTLDGEV